MPITSVELSRVAVRQLFCLRPFGALLAVTSFDLRAWAVLVVVRFHFDVSGCRWADTAVLRRQLFERGRKPCAHRPTLK